MAAYNFPDSPTIGQTYGIYKWDGEKWVWTVGGRPATAFDPYWANVILLVSGVGANNATVFPDLSSGAHGNGTRTGSPIISTTAPITGNASSILTTTSDYINWNVGVNCNTPTADTAVWTIEMVWKPSAAGSVWGFGDPWSGIGTWGGFLQTLSDGSFRFYDLHNVSGWDFSSAAGQWTSGTEYYVVGECNGNKLRLYLGTLAGGTFTMIASTTTAATNTRELMCWNTWLSNYGYGGNAAGKFNWLRITKGIARYNSDSAVAIPTFPLPTG